MQIDLTQKSRELKEFVSQYETTMFLGDISSLMQEIRFNPPSQTLKGLSSPQRQLMYLAGLNVSSAIPDSSNTKSQFSDEEFEHMKNLLNQIEEGYEQFFYPKPEDEIDEEWKMRRMISMPTFLSYFNQGLLNYEEQIIERVSEYFTPLNAEIKNHFGLEVTDFIDIYNLIDKVPNNFLMDKINKKEGSKSWDQICNEMKEKNLLPWEWQDHLPQPETDLFNWMHDNGMMLRFSKEYLNESFGNSKPDLFLEIFTSNRAKTNFLYYTEKNVLHYKPIFKIDSDTFQAIEMNQIIQAVYNTLFEFCTSDEKLREKFYAIRGKRLEEKIENTIQRFFKNKAHVHKGYFTQDGKEQDLLFLIDGLALIVEAKASKRDEPRREPEKAYPLIVSNFEEVIQKGYDQAYRVKSKFISRDVLQIFKDKEKRQHVIDIKTKNYQNAFSIVVTLERFGQIQTDLLWMLNIYENDEYPWSICIDDLEAFLLLMERLGKKKSDLTQFLLVREKLHGRLFTADELEVCGAFVTDKINIKHANVAKNVFALTPAFADIFDEIYQKKGLGFDNEKNMEIKTSGKYIPLGGF
jgi:hypothetical protein